MVKNIMDVIKMNKKELYESLVEKKIEKITNCIIDNNVKYEETWSADGGGYTWNYDVILMGNDKMRETVINQLRQIDDICVCTEDDYDLGDKETYDGEEEIYIYIDMAIAMNNL